MQVGTYTFDADVAEVMDVLGGSVKVKFPGSDAWKVYEAGMRFEVPVYASFTVEVGPF